MAQDIRILLIDDHSLFREGLARLLEAEPEFRMVGSCASIEEAWSLLERTSVDIILLDYDLGEEQGGPAFLDRIKSSSFEGKILMVTAGMTDADTLRALDAGCSGIFLKHSPPAQLVEAIHKIMAGEMWVDSRAVRSLVAGAKGNVQKPPLHQALSGRERAVLKAVFEGLNNKEIATHLGISEGSVKWALQQLFEKTGVRTRGQLVRIALERHSLDWIANEPAS